LDLDKLKRAEYNLEELIEKQNDLGEYEGFPLIVKNGKYGPYVKWGENTESLRNIGIPLENIEREHLIKYLQNKKNGGENNGGENNGGDSDGNGVKNLATNTRIINKNLSIRVGKFGPYIFYKTPTMKKPVFHPMKKCPLKYTDCDAQLLLNWINSTYQLNEIIE
jgi:topoisomerase IA-like protein